MLQSLRQASKSWVMKIILGLLALTFVVFFGNSFVGSGGGFFGGGNTAIVEVGDVGYTAYDISEEFGRQIQRAQANPRFAGLTQEQAIQLGMLDQTINQIVARTLVDIAADDLGIVAGDGDVSALVRQLPQFQNTAGRFDRIRFESYLRANRISEQQYINQLRGDLVRSQLIGTLNAGVKVPATLVDRFYRYNAERRVADIVVIDAASLTDIPLPDEAQIGAFFEASKKIFEAPEYRSGTMVSLTLEQFAEEIGVSDEEIAAAYEARRGEFITPERRQIETVLFASKEEAEKAQARILAGETFKTVAEDIAGLPPVDLGLVAREDVPVEELGSAAFAMSDPGVSVPIESPFGWNLVRVVAISPASEKSLAEATPDLRRAVALDRARDDIFEVLEAFEDALAGGATLEEAATETGLNVKKIGPFARDGSTPTENAATNPDHEAIAALFEGERGDAGRVVERDNGGFLAVRIEEVQAPRIPSLADIRDKVVAAWTQEQRLLEAEKIAAEIADRARETSLTAAAAKTGYTAARTEPFDRIGQGADIAVEAIEPLFAAASGEIVKAVTTNGAIVAQLVEIIAPPSAAPERERLQGAIAQSISDDIQAQLVNALRAQNEVDIDAAALQRLFATQ